MNVTRRLLDRGFKYAVVGVSTFILDLGIIFLLIQIPIMPYPLAVAIGFLIGISVNYFICYYWVYAGTERLIHHGYLYFVSLALLGAFIIAGGTTFLVEQMALSLIVARIIMGASTGTIGFFINTFFNFRLL